MRPRTLVAATAVSLGLLAAVSTSPASGDTLTMKDGTTLSGTVKKMGGSYSVRDATGLMRLVGGGEVAAINGVPVGGAEVKPDAKPDAKSGAAKPAKPAKPDAAKPHKPPAAPSANYPGTTPAFSEVKGKADGVDVASLGAALWQQFVDDHPDADPADKAAAQKELARWRKMSAEGAEKIDGKWMAGKELKALNGKVQKLLKEAADAMNGNQTLVAIKKLEEAIKADPTNFEANFTLGYFYLVKGENKNIQQAISVLETASKIRPTSAAVWSNLAIAYNFRHLYVDSVEAAYKAAQIEDSKPIVQNLVNSIAQAPPGMRRNNSKIRSIMEEATVLASKYGVSNGMQGWAYISPEDDEKAERHADAGEKGEKPPAGLVGSGTGFFVSDDGLIMTNRHVAGAGDHLIVRLSDGTEKLAQVVVIGEDQDVALIKIKTDGPVPFIHMAATDQPKEGEDVTVLGFPLGSALGSNVKITRGVVTSLFEIDSDNPCDVLVDAQVNPGNSGGPMVDEHGNLLALVAMKTGSGSTISSYGLGISTGRLRKFLAGVKNKYVEKSKADFSAGGNDQKLNTQQIAEKYRPATVCILMVNGEIGK